ADAPTPPPAPSRCAHFKTQHASLPTVVHRNTHSLARFFLEIDANYKQFRTGSRLRAAAARRLDAQRAYYEEGRITIDRILDAVSQYVAAIADEAQYKTRYNNSIVALEEAKGTLLEYDQITVVDGPQSAVSAATAPLSPSAPIAPHSLQPLGAPATVPPPARLTTNEPYPPAAPPKGDPSAGKTFSFDLTVGTGSTPIQIRGSFTITPTHSPAAPKVQ
ncbi:MAG: TolC family protein, partial [Isosphaerales bacterium]